ncbi:hypothetical protein FOB63_002297 [Clavispora lusitaniae]|uniref:uncharacterized protein n=1 Tax=Clavispora lusitaniae TaxID=36911 RepID=UPI00202C3636|nr:hypothetical protein FOB63_002297 [Clavispora lusitaniae]
MDQKRRVEDHPRCFKKMQTIPWPRCSKKSQTVDIEVHEDDRNLPIARILGIPKERPFSIKCILDFSPAMILLQWPLSIAE